jgi:phosphohistidine phosphatase SixA
MKQVCRVALLCVLALAFDSASALAQDQVFFVVRHAERADGGASGQTMAGADPDLSEAGHARASRLADMLRDAGVQQIFTTEYRRTKQTGAPLAEKLNLQPVITTSKDVDTLIERLRATKGATLVIAHSNTLPQIVKGLGVSTPITVGEEDYGDLFIIVRPGTGEATLIRMKY